MNRTFQSYIWQKESCLPSLARLQYKCDIKKLVTGKVLFWKFLLLTVACGWSVTVIVVMSWMYMLFELYIIYKSINVIYFDKSFYLHIPGLYVVSGRNNRCKMCWNHTMWMVLNSAFIEIQSHNSGELSGSVYRREIRTAYVIF